MGSIPTPTPSKAWAESNLFKPIRAGAVELQHRVVLAPLTRFRATKAHVPSELQLQYYSQRASTPGTLLITEATYISAQGGGMDNVPGVWSDEQVAGWKKIVDAVHARGSFIFLQIWALGRAADPAVIGSADQTANPGGPHPYAAPSAIPLSDRTVAPRALTESEIEGYIHQFGVAARNAVFGAGFDGVEIHGAHGYLIDQFIQSNSNQRDDKWGGSVEGRSRFALAVVDSVVRAVGAERTGIRFSPWSTYQDMRMPDPSPKETFSYLVRSIRDAYPNFAYIHAPEPRVAGTADRDALKSESNDFLRYIWLKEDGKPHNRVYISAGGYSAADAVHAADERGDLVAFGRHYIANPDLPARIQKQLPLTRYDRSTFYAPESPKGYADYPFADADTEANYRKFL